MSKVAVVKPINTNVVITYNGNFYNELIGVAKPHKTYISTTEVRSGNVYIAEEQESVLATITKFFSIDGHMHRKQTIYRATICTILTQSKDIPNNRLTVEANTYKIGDILDDNTVICKIGSRWYQRKTGKYLEYVYFDHSKAKFHSNIPS